MSRFPFAKLPAELRFMLWRFTWKDRVVIIQLGKLDVPRSKNVFYAELAHSGRSNSSLVGGKDFNKNIMHTHARLPWTFFLNSESRYVSLKYYKLAFQLAGYENRVYLGQGDIPCILQCDLETFGGTELSQVKELMVMWEQRYDPFCESIFHLPKINDGGSEEYLKRVTLLTCKDFKAMYPKLQWLYWMNKYRYTIHAWELRSARERDPDLISKSWTRSIRLEESRERPRRHG